jgi:hypothetical protein
MEEQVISGEIYGGVEIHLWMYHYFSISGIGLKSYGFKGDP